MKDLLDLILKNITTHPEAALIEETTEGDVTVYTISVDPEDMGRVIGKDGKVIRAIRSLAHVVAIRQSKRFRVTLNDSANPAVVPPEAKTAQPEEPEDLIAGAIDINEPVEVPEAEKPRSKKGE